MDLVARLKSVWLVPTQILLLLGLVTLGYFSSISALYARWIMWDQSLSHGLPTIGIFLFLLWRAQPWSYQTDSTKRRAILLLLLCGASISWFLFDKTQIGILSYLVLLPLLWLLIASSYSLKTALHLSAAIGILIFAIPIWEQLTNLLVALSAAAVSLMGQVVDIPILIDGNNIFLPYGRLYIDDGCSGLRYLTIALLMAYLISCIHDYRFRHIIIAFCIAISLALLSNWIRIFSLVMIGYYTDMQSSLLQDHEMFGWILFACVMFPCIYFSPNYPSQKNQQIPQTTQFKPLLPILMIAFGPVLAFVFSSTVTPPRLANLAALHDFESFSTPLESFAKLKLPETDIYEQAHYSFASHLLQVELAQYPKRNPREKLVPYFGTLYDKINWVFVAEETSPALAKIGAEITILRRVNSQQQLVLLYRYQVGSYATSSYEKAKLLQFPAAIFEQNNFNILTIQTVCNNADCSQAINAATLLAASWVDGQVSQDGEDASDAPDAPEVEAPKSAKH